MLCTYLTENRETLLCYPKVLEDLKAILSLYCNVQYQPITETLIAIVIKMRDSVDLADIESQLL